MTVSRYLPKIEPEMAHSLLAAIFEGSEVYAVDSPVAGNAPPEDYPRYVRNPKTAPGYMGVRADRLSREQRQRFAEAAEVLGGLFLERAMALHGPSVTAQEEAKQVDAILKRAKDFLLLRIDERRPKTT